MSARKLLVLLVLFAGLAALLMVSFGPALAYRPVNSPPECYPILSIAPGYWGMACHDRDGNIVSAELNTDAPHHLYWDESNVQMIVEVGDQLKKPLVFWQVCDKFGACKSGTYD